MTRWRDLVHSAFVCALYVMTAKLGLQYAVVGQTVTLLWLPSGIALAATLLGGYRLWPGIASGALLANLDTDVPTLTVALIVVGNTLEPTIATFLIRRHKTFSSALEKVSDVLALVFLAAVVSTSVSASFGTLALYLGEEIGVSDLMSTWLTWWLGDGMGVLVLAPIILTGLTTLRASPTAFSLGKFLEALILFVAVIGMGYAIFGSATLAGSGHFPVSLSMFPFAIWSGLSFGPLGAASVALVSSALSIHGTVSGTGPFVGDSAIESLIRWCLFADIMAITGLLLGAISSEREKALQALRNSNEELEQRVCERTNDLSDTNLKLQKTLAERRRLQLEMNQISEERQKMIGQELHDSLGQQLTGIAFLLNSLQASLNVTATSEVHAFRQVRQLLDESIAVVRSLARGLYPVTLESGGLSSALQHLAEHAGSSGGIQCTVRCAAAADPIDKTIALNLYRIAQEAVCNALRHSEARHIDIKFTTAGDRYVLSVKDDGIGMPVEAGHGSFGMRSMRNRADLISAEIDAMTSSEGGTSIRVTGPMKLKLL